MDVINSYKFRDLILFEWLDRIRGLAGWVRDELGVDMAFHLLRFHPNYEVRDVASTSVRSLERACDVARDVELRYVYMGNVPRHRCENTYCLGCGELLVSGSVLML